MGPAKSECDTTKGISHVNESPESHSDGEACGVTPARLKAEKDPVAAAFMSEQKCDMRAVIQHGTR